MCPTLAQSSDPTPIRFPRPMNVAHRGASAEAPENTLSAVRRAVALGADLVEIDVQRTRDGALVVLHDTTLSRTTDAQQVYPQRRAWRLSDFTYDELCRLDAGGWKSEVYVGERIPLLTDVLDSLRGTGVGLQLELKEPELYPGVVDDLTQALRDEAACGGRVTEVVVQSFHVASMKELKVRLPDLRVGLLGAPALRNLPALATWADQVNPHHRQVNRDYVAAVQRLGMQACVWTVDRPSALRRALAMGVDGVITNRPDRLYMIRSRAVGAGMAGGSDDVAALGS